MEDLWGSILPEDLWMRILETGLSSGLSCRDLCRLSLTCKRLNTLSNRHFLWSALLSADFKHGDPLPADPSSSSPSYKALYRSSYERKRDQKRLARRRAVLRCKCHIGAVSEMIADSERQLAGEREKMRVTLERAARQGSAELNDIWQQVIRGKHKQYDANSQISSLGMELWVCKRQIDRYDVALDIQKQRLASLKHRLKRHHIRKKKLK